MSREKDVKGMTLGKKENFSEWFSEIVGKAELADLRYNLKGFVVNRPWSVMCMKKMYRLYEEELERKGHVPVLFPAVIPVENFEKEAEHVEDFFPQVFWVTEAGRGKKLEEKMALRPTSETAMYRMYSLWIRSWRDLPLKMYQSCQVWRYETKMTRPFIRGREFHWIEAHDVFATRKEAEAQVMEDMEITDTVMFRQFGIPFIFFKRPEWDKFPGAVDTYAADTLMPDGKVLQQPSTHMLGQNFSKPFGIKFKDRGEKEAYGWQTCYGPAIWRIFASVVAEHGDDKGLSFPWEIAPVQIVIVPIYESKSKAAVLKKARELKKKMEGFSVHLDDREQTPGWKFNEWELKGVPVRIELGPKEVKQKKLTLYRRDTGKKSQAVEAKLSEALEKLGKEITRNLVARAEKGFRGSIRSAKDMKDLKAKLKLGGFVRVDFCSRDKAGEPCAERIKTSLQGDVRGTRADNKEKPKGKCIACGKKAKVVVYVGKSY